jgi:hypothetical protein
MERFILNATMCISFSGLVNDSGQVFPLAVTELSPINHFVFVPVIIHATRPKSIDQWVGNG